MMNKGQLAGLMKQAQQMQENVRKMQEQLATVEVEGQSGAGMVKVVMTCRYDVKRVSIDPSLARRRQGDARGPRGGGGQRRGPARRVDGAGEDGERHRGPAAAAGDEALLTDEACFRAGGADRRAAVPAGRGAEIGAADGLSPAAVRSRRRPAARRRARSCAREDPAVRPVQHVHRGGDLRPVRVAEARPGAPLRRRDAGRSRHDGTDARLPRALLRADGAAIAARWRRPAGHRARPARRAGRPTAW